jgi:hypothetical protein
VRCLSCGYDLRNLTEHRCPECGREFDPNDPSTFEARAVSRSVNVVVGIGFLLIAILILALPLIYFVTIVLKSFR